MSKAPLVKVERYYSLHVSSLILKTLAVLVVLVAVGGLGFISLQAANSPLPDYQDFQMWLPSALSLTIGGALLAFLFHVLAQLLDVQRSTNEKLRQLVNQLEAGQSETLTEEVKRLSTLVEQQSRLIRLQQTASNATTPQQVNPQQAKTQSIK